MNAHAIPSGHPMPAPSLVDTLASELGQVAGRIEREAKLRLDAIVAELRQESAERALQFVTLQRQTLELGERFVTLSERIDARIASIKDGEPGPAGPPGPPGERGEAGERGEKGETGADGPVGPAGPTGATGKAGSPGERGDKGEQGADGPVGPAGPVGAAGARGEKGDTGEAGAVGPLGPVGPQGERGADGLLGEVRAWNDGVHYRGELRSHLGGTYQALRDTAKAPPHEDWICIAAPGRDGRTPRVRGTYGASVTDYAELDVVALDGCAFMARCDSPGACPGDGWQMISLRGKVGKPGERGSATAVRVTDMTVDGEGMLELVNSDGSIVRCDLYPVLVKLQRSA